MIAIVRRFAGKPISSDDGELAYQFPQLKESDLSAKFLSDIDQEEDTFGSIVPPPIYEKQWKFSEATDFQISIAIGLGILNFIECFVVT